jgi:FtsP/CotA-like multicopper oxidase with cupredoxin domain
MMRHPMHLHGFDFRVLNGKGENAPMKNIIDIMPMETDTIEFAANEEGDWFFHCHILYHMMSGMNRVFAVAIIKTRTCRIKLNPTKHYKVKAICPFYGPE